MSGIWANDGIRAERLTDGSVEIETLKHGTTLTAAQWDELVEALRAPGPVVAEQTGEHVTRQLHLGGGVAPEQI